MTFLDMMMSIQGGKVQKDKQQITVNYLLNQLSYVWLIPSNNDR